MKFFGGSKKPSSTSTSKQHTPGSSIDERDLFPQRQHSEPSSPTKSTGSNNKSPSKKSSRPPSYRAPKDAEKSSAPRHARLSRHSTEPSASSLQRGKIDIDTHPLNLPPEERRRLSKLSNSTMSDQMDVDREPVNGASAPAPQNQNASAQANFSVPITNGNHSEEAPAPPPHRSNPSSPVPTPQDDAEAYKAAGNRFFKEKNYTKAIEQYSKGDECNLGSGIQFYACVNSTS